MAAGEPTAAVPKPLEIFAAGRLCLFGEHSDWAGGYCRAGSSVRPGCTIVVGTDAGLHCRVWPLTEQKLVISTVTAEGSDAVRHGPHELDLASPRQLLEEARQGGFWSYVAGTAYHMVVENHVGGLRIDNYRTTLPMKKGLSSSAAICVVVARAFNQTFDLKLTTRGEMAYAYAGERLTPSMCGRMDQCGAFGQVPLVMRFEGEAVDVEQLRLGATLHLVLVDLRASKNTVAILAGLQAAYPEALTMEQLALHDLLGPVNERITGCAMRLLAAGDAAGLGALMVEAQREFDAKAAPVCPQHLASPMLHRVLSHGSIQQHIHGGKGVGSQGDGTAQLICRDPEAQHAVCSILETELGVHCTKLTLQPTRSSGPNRIAAAAQGVASAVDKSAPEEQCRSMEPLAATRDQGAAAKSPQLPQNGLALT